MNPMLCTFFFVSLLETYVASWWMSGNRKPVWPGVDKFLERLFS